MVNYPPFSGIALVATGGFAGALTRYGIDVALPSTLVATLTVNVIGSFVLGLLFFGNRGGDLLGEQATLIGATGFVSSFTTYSTFVVDAVLAAPATAGVYVLASYLLGFGAVLVGRPAGERLARSKTAIGGNN